MEQIEKISKTGAEPSLYGPPKNNRVLNQELTKGPSPCWPLDKELQTQHQQVQKKFYSIKEVSQMYGIGRWLIYSHIKTDPTFPYVNVGIKKKLLIDLKNFEQWLVERTQRNKQERHQLPDANELMRVGT